MDGRRLSSDHRHRLSQQEDTFVGGEADRFFERNRDYLRAGGLGVSDAAFDLVLRLKQPPEHIVEIGAANGFRVAALRDALGSRVTAVEPSGDAVADGRARWPDVTFHQGVASAVPLPDAVADCVIVNFVFHWIDRAQLFRAAAEADRILRDGGHLVVGDFLPPSPRRVRYHHLPDDQLWTYKQDYSALFAAAGTHAVAERRMMDHRTHKAVTQASDPDDVTAITLLRKDLDGLYTEVVRGPNGR